MKTFQGQIAAFVSLGNRIGAESERIQAIRNLPSHFWDIVRSESMKWLKLSTEISPSKYSRDQIEFARVGNELMDTHGALHVALIVLPRLPLQQLEQVKNQIRTKLQSNGKLVHAVVGDQISVLAAPVEDFEKFVAEVDYGSLIDRDDGQRMVVVDPSGGEVLADKGVVIPQEAASKGKTDSVNLSENSPRIEPNSRDYQELAARYGKDKVVCIQITNQPDIITQLNEAAEAISNASPEVIACRLTGRNACVAPVVDFDAFCAGLDFATIVARDDVQRTLTITVDPTKLVDAARVQRVASQSRPGIQRESDLPVRVPRSIPFRMDRGDELPLPSDPDYYRKLCDLMTGKVNSHIQRMAIDRLLETNPSEIKDNNVRAQIARNFRDMATHDGSSEGKGQAIEGLALYGGTYSIPILTDLLNKSSLNQPRELFEALASFPDARCADAISRKLGDMFCHVQAVEALRRIGPVAEDSLIKVAPSNKPAVSLAAVELLGEVGTSKSLPLLGKASRSSNPEVRTAAEAAATAIRARSKKPARPTSTVSSNQ